MRDTILLVGGYRLQSMSASTVRALGLAQLFESLGYRVVVMGKFDDVPPPDAPTTRLVIDGIDCHDIRQPVTGRKPADYAVSAEALMALVDDLGARRVRAVVCYNYPARGAWSMIRGCRARGIAPVLDCTEWYGWEGRKILRNLYRMAGVEIRMRLLTRMAGNVIGASHWFGARVAGLHTVLLPFVLDTSQPRWARAAPPDFAAPPHFVYSGSPGLGLHKDRLPPMIDGFHGLAAEGHRFRVSIAGLTQAQYLAIVPQHAPLVRDLGDRLDFLGQIAHDASLDLVRHADFSVFFRQPNKVSNTGFATKFVEALTLGVPVISNATSDIPLFLHDGVNGILARSIADTDVVTALRRAVLLNHDQRSAMNAALRRDNPFEMRLWADPARVFLQKLRGIND